MNRVAQQGDTNHGAIKNTIQNEKAVVRLVIGKTSREKRFGKRGGLKPQPVCDNQVRRHYRQVEPNVDDQKWDRFFQSAHSVRRRVATASETAMVTRIVLADHFWAGHFSAIGR